MMHVSIPLRVAINAQFVPEAGIGGVESVLVALIKELGDLQDGSEEYVIIINGEHNSWWKPYIGPNQRVVSPPRRTTSTGKREVWRRTLQPFRRVLREIWNGTGVRPVAAWPQVPISDGFFESLNCDVIHFPYQDFVLSAVPSIYNPHDLQHLHYPQFFSAEDIAWRETIYPAGCRFSKCV